MNAWIHVDLLQLKGETIYLSKRFVQLLLKETHHIFQICRSVISLSNERNHNENIKMCMLIQHTYVDILFLLTKVIPVMFERVALIPKLFGHLQAIMQPVTITSTHYHTRFHTRYRTFSLGLTQIGHNGTHYHNFNALTHALPYIFSRFSMAWWQFVTCQHALPSNL